MQYKSFGKTGKEISVIGFGCMRFRYEEYSKGDYDTAARMILRAREAGVNYFDTAPGYCGDHSEKILGYALAQMKDKPYVSTKCGLWMATTADEARKKIESSLKALGIDKITVYNMWCIKTLDEYRQMTKKGGMYDGILKAKQEGLIEHICCTSHADGDDVAEIVNDGRVEAVTLGYNALNFAYRRKGVKSCHDAGLGVVIMNPLGGGVLPRHPDKFGFLKEHENQTIANAALRFLIGQEAVTCALPGFETMEQLEDCLTAAQSITPVTDEMMDTLSTKLSKELDTLCTGCSYCECPLDIPVDKYMEVYNEYMLEGNSRPVIEQRLRDFWGITVDAARGCTECGKCESECTQKLPIIERLKVLAGE
ncbi:MAG: aldo/keto reductase [Oscillospiraceae bacterium]|nr:aldo/keto reductase [Oscillospiraceae bacterium]